MVLLHKRCGKANERGAAAWILKRNTTELPRPRLMEVPLVGDRPIHFFSLHSHIQRKDPVLILKTAMGP